MWLRGRAALVGMMMLSTVAATGQVSRDSTRAFHVNDSVVVEVVGRAIIEKASHLFVRAALEGTQIPLQITLPEGATSHQWQALLDHLMVSLKGRSLQTPDNLQHVIEIRGLELGVGTMRFGLHVGVRWRCGVKWLINGNSYGMRWIRYGSEDRWGQTRTEMEIHDNDLCPADPE
jgi:hypothetical protein